MSKSMKWGLSAGCILPLCCLIFVGGLTGIILTVIRNSDVTAEAIAVIQADPYVRDTLGEPVEIGWFITGNVEVNGDSGYASLNIPVSGPRGSGGVIVDATRSGGNWGFDAMMFAADGEEAVDLLRR